MNRQLKIFLAGLFAIIPIALTIAVIIWAGSMLDGMGKGAIKLVWVNLLDNEGADVDNLHGVGVLLLFVTIYLVGLLTHVWLFRKLLGLVEGIFAHVPGIKTIYESVRDLMKLFGSGSKQKMGRVVEYCPAGTAMGMLGIMTSQQPEGASGDDKAAVYFPLGYMIGGPVLFVPKCDLRTVDMPVERALRLCATAYVGIEKNDQTQTESVDNPN